MATSKVGSFVRDLQTEFTPSDATWSYNIQGLPKVRKVNSARLVKSLELVSNSNTRQLKLTFKKVDPNRATASIPLDRLIHFSFADFRLGYYEDGQWKSCTARESINYLVRLLKSGITINNVLYSFYGHSSSQLKSRSCYLLKGSRDDVSGLVESLGDFSKIKTVAKKAKRIGLLFSSCHTVINVSEERYEDIDDVERSGYNFTDGCGLIGPSTAKLLACKLSIVARNTKYSPSIYQIRFKGYKGIVILEPQMRKDCWFQFRHSMRKFSGTTDPSFAVVEYSKPYTYGYLNDDIVLLLHALGITVDVFLAKQDGHFQLLQQAITDPSTAFMVLCALDKVDVAEKLVLHGIARVSSTIQSVVTSEHAKMLNKRHSQKCRILVPNSRLIFGACDPRGVLAEGECFLRITDETAGGQARTIKNCEVLVTRNPCLHPGDLRKLRAVDRPELSHLKDCIIFSVQGARPAADQMSGGDLDGDTFFVCWDSALVPTTISQPAEYPPGTEPPLLDKITAEHRIEYFAGYTSISLGRVKNLFIEWARQKGPFSSECQELNRLHSLCVDGNRIKIPSRLETLSTAEGNLRELFILDILHHRAAEKAQEKLVRKTSLNQLDSREVVEEILCQPRSCSEFYMLQLVHDWCRQRGDTRLDHFLLYFNLAALTVEQRHWLLQELPANIDYPSWVMNSLLNSTILHPRELSPFHLDYAGLRWKRIFSDQDRLGNLLEVIEKTFSQFHRKLLVLHVQERFSIAIYLPQKVPSDEDTLVGRGVRVLSFPHTHDNTSDYYRILATGVEYRLYYDQDYLQLYDRQRGNTFIWIGRPGNDTSSYRNIKGAASRARERQATILRGENHDWAISIALQKFGKGIQSQIGRIRREGILAAELYVISNTDAESLRTLDLWLESVDTNEIQPIFEQVPPPLLLPQLSGVDWAHQPQHVRILLERGNLSILDEVFVQADILFVLQFCFEHGETSAPSKIYRHYLECPSKISTASDPDALLRSLIQGLFYTPGNAIFFSRLSPWRQVFMPDLDQCLRSEAMRLLKAIIEASNSAGTFTMEAMRNVLDEANSMTVASFREIVEQVCVTVDSPDQIFNILFEVLEPMSYILVNESSCARDYLTRNLFGVALDHSEEAHESFTKHDELWKFEPFTISTIPPVLTSNRRIDAPQLDRLVAGDHVQFKLARFPENVFLSEHPRFNAIIEMSQLGVVTFRSLSCPPAFTATARWVMKHCGSFVTTKAMFDALVTLIEDKQDACALYPLLVEGQPLPNNVSEPIGYGTNADLNKSQNEAVMASLTSPLTCIWGPPGSGKTQTVVRIIQQLLRLRLDDRILITAPTHNAVDNILRRYLHDAGPIGTTPLRVSTSVRKVAADLIGYTCDAMEGKEINLRPELKRQALERIQKSRLIFTTCAGAGLGLLRNEKFQTVIIDEASQQTEPMSLIPLSKGCTKAILVGDHVQLRVTVHGRAKATELEVSLFERLYKSNKAMAGLSKAMLKVQYRMHPQLCQFPSEEFYDAELKTDISCHDNAPAPSLFPWPRMTSSVRGAMYRNVLIPCFTEEDIGYRSKGNVGQAQLCKEVYRLLTSPPSSLPDKASISSSMSIAVLTPYTRQVKILKEHLPQSSLISSIDAFQGQEADIVIYVTVRCNPHGDLGFLSDLRRLNVVLTRAKAGLIVIGCPRTLSKGVESTLHGAYAQVEDRGKNTKLSHSLAIDGDSQPVWERLLRSLTKVDISVP